jgi:hypothetical protein
MWHATLNGDVVGEVERPGSLRDRHDWRGQLGDIETPALVVRATAG